MSSDIYIAQRSPSKILDCPPMQSLVQVPISVPLLEEEPVQIRSIEGMSLNMFLIIRVDKGIEAWKKANPSLFTASENAYWKKVLNELPENTTMKNIGMPWRKKR